MSIYKSPFRHDRAYKGGSGAVATPTPPAPSATSVEVQQAKQDAAKQATKRLGISKTILAGDTGGLGSTQQTAQKATILGSVGK